MEISLIYNKITLDKIIFEKIISILDTITMQKHDEDHFEKLLNIMVSLILKNHMKDDWFLKKLFIFFFENQKYPYFLYDTLTCSYPDKLHKIYHILQKYKTSTFIKIFMETTELKIYKETCWEDWITNNEKLFFFNFQFMTLVVPHLLNNIKILNDMTIFDTIPEQLLYIVNGIRE